MEKVTYEYIKDYELAGKKVGDRISIRGKVPMHLRALLKEVDGEPAAERPTEKWTKDQIVEWLNDNGVENATGTKAELLELVADLK